MKVADVALLLDYGQWANTRLFDVMSTLTADQFTKTVAGSYGSIRNTMVHMLSADWGWLERSGGPPRGPALKAGDYPTLASVVELASRIDRMRREWLATAQESDLDRVVEFTLGATGARKMSVREMLHHAANHGTHHRGQVALLLRMLDVVPGNFDVLFYYPPRP